MKSCFQTLPKHLAAKLVGGLFGLGFVFSFLKSCLSFFLMYEFLCRLEGNKLFLNAGLLSVVFFSTTKYFKHAFKPGISKASTFQIPDNNVKQIHCLKPILTEETGTSQMKPSVAKPTRSLAGNSPQRYLVFPRKLNHTVIARWSP